MAASPACFCTTMAVASITFASSSGVTPAGSRCTITSRSATRRSCTSCCGRRAFLLHGQRIGQRPHLGRDRLFEAFQPQFRERHVAVGDGLPQSETPRPFDRLGQRSRPSEAGRRGIGATHRLAASIQTQLRIGPSCRLFPPGLGREDFRFVESEFPGFRQASAPPAG